MATWDPKSWRWWKPLDGVAGRCGCPIIYPVLNEDYATMIARDWNVPASGVGYVTRFEIAASYGEQFDVHQVGGDTILELWVPAEDLEEFNDHIVGGLIEVVAEFR